jgi:hypothetical protein
MLKTAEGKWILFAVDGGEQKEFWPIDGKALLASGSHTTEPPAGKEPVIRAAPPRNVGVPQLPTVQTFVAPDGEASRTRTRPKAE